jgi:hypothetical protein
VASYSVRAMVAYLFGVAADDASLVRRLSADITHIV